MGVKSTKTIKPDKTTKTVKPTKPAKTDKTDCFAYKSKECIALNKKSCDGCNFYKTTAEVKADREKAVVRIATLDIETQKRIAKAYFGGNDGSL